jgi:hypothetical protein
MDALLQPGHPMPFGAFLPRAAAVLETLGRSQRKIRHAIA